MVNVADKTLIVAFAGPDVTQSSIEQFEDKFAAGRAWHDDFCAAVTSSFSGSEVNELAEICLKEFTPDSNQFHPYFFIVLDDRTNKDGSVLLYHQGTPGGDPAPREELRISPASLPSLISVMNVGMRDILYIKANEAPDDPEELATWFHDVPMDNSDTHQTARVPIEDCVVTRVNDHFRKIGIPAERVATAGLSKVPVELAWFGDVGRSVLLFSCWEKNSPEKKFVMGQQIEAGIDVV